MKKWNSWKSRSAFEMSGSKLFFLAIITRNPLPILMSKVASLPDVLSTPQRSDGIKEGRSFKPVLPYLALFEVRLAQFFGSCALRFSGPRKVTRICNFGP